MRLLLMSGKIDLLTVLAIDSCATKRDGLALGNGSDGHGDNVLLLVT